MTTLEIYHPQSLVGGVFRAPYYAARFILLGLFKLLALLLIPVLFVWLAIKYLLVGLKKLVLSLIPEFYGGNISHTFTSVFCVWKFVFSLLSLFIIVLIPLHMIAFNFITIYRSLLDPLTLLRSLFLMAIIFVTIVTITIVMAFLSFVIMSILITLYSPVKTGSEIGKGFISSILDVKVFLLLIFMLALLIFGPLMLIKSGIIQEFFPELLSNYLTS
ncbi:hypothetical protein GF339_03695 [candidate division KSB3 bacterium]|uniref:Uncharacterized protein n=1 Tax=candidate division KSB3 bacterium TaxID=2044937 RepID=A0A9D5JTD7_9BACT|nr:hypothetical protein [candidate division KSB3 bacterium]MBD3323661.1 hypothetical protein [candidate division KSB3 bacterium]